MAQPLARDTTPAAEARQIIFFQQRTPEERLALTFDLSAFALAASRAAIRRAQPNLSPLEHARLLIALLFGPRRAAQMQRAPDLEGNVAIPSAILPVVQLFEHMEVPYYISGSIASSAYSLPRTTYDVDMVAALQLRHVTAFAGACGGILR